MSDDVTVVPISQPEMTEKQVEYSVKIARNALRKELQSRFKLLSVEERRLEEIYRKKIKEYSTPWAAHAHNEIYLTFCNESKYQSLVFTFNLLNPPHENPIENIAELFINSESSRIIHNLLTGNYELEDNSNTINTVDISINIRLAVLNQRATEDIKDDNWPEGQDIQHSLYIPYEIDESLLEDIKDCQTAQAEWQKIRKQAIDIEQQLQSLDDTLEDIEAQILMASLTKTSEGSVAATITNNIINGVLGALPALPAKE